MTAPVVGLLALQGDLPEHRRALLACGAQVRPVRRRADLPGLNGLVLPGGESTTMATLLGHWDLFGPLQEQISAGMPVYGSCAGMILLADRLTGGPAGQRTLGGLDVTVRRNAFGRQIDSFEEELHAPGFGVSPGAPPMRAIFIRAPWVQDHGPGVEVLATVTSGPAAGKIVAVRQDALLATAFHPELSGDLRVHRTFVDLVVSHHWTAQ